MEGIFSFRGILDFVVPMFVKKNRQKQKKSVKICKFITQKKNSKQIKTLLYAKKQF